MRRLKKDVLRELPEKIESIMYNQMSTEQAKLYTAWQMRAKKEFEEEVNQTNGQTNKIRNFSSFKPDSDNWHATQHFS